MFAYDPKLENINGDYIFFNTSNIINAAGMFRNDASMELNLSFWLVTEFGSFSDFTGFNEGAPNITTPEWMNDYL